MIIDHISNWRKYAAINRYFPAAFAYLEQLGGKLPAGDKIILDGSNLYALPMSVKGRGREAARLEAHRKYIDIQFIVSGVDVMGWKPLSGCRTVAAGYDGAKDIEFFSDKADTYCDVGPMSFAIFLPEDGHAPLAGDAGVNKVVVKVAV